MDSIQQPSIPVDPPCNLTSLWANAMAIGNQISPASRRRLPRGLLTRSPSGARAASSPADLALTHE